MAEVASAYVSLLPSAKGFGRQLNSQIGPDLDRSGKSGGKRFGASFGGAARSLIAPALALVGVAAVSNFLKDSVAEAREAQKVGAQTAQVIKTTGGAANITAKQVGKLATAISLKTGMDDEAIQSGANLLLTFRNIRNEAGKGNQIFSRATAVATDLSVAMKTDLTGASKQLGKALNDPIKGTTALSRAGVQFTDSQKAQIKSMVKSNDLLGAQKIVLKEIETQVGGSAAAQATAGEKAAVAWANLKEQLGTALLPIIDRVATIISTKVVPAISKFISEMQDGTGTGGKVADVLRVVGDALGVVFDFINNNRAVVATFVGVIVVMTAAFAALNLVLAINPFTLIVLAIAALAAGFVYAYKKSETFRGLVNGLWNNVLKPFGSWLSGVLPPAIRIVGDVFLTMIQAVITANHWLLNVVLTVFSGIIHGAAKAFGWVPGLGGKIKGAAKGFDTMKDLATTALTKVENKIKDTRDDLDGLGRTKAKPSITLDGAPKAISQAKSLLILLGAIDKKKTSGKVPPGMFNPGKNAKGTDNWRGGLTWVGEEGPELINLAKGAQVIPNNKIGDVSNSRSAVGSLDSLSPAAIRAALDGMSMDVRLTGGDRAKAQFVQEGIKAGARL